jgi:hypothetical protein
MAGLSVLYETVAQWVPQFRKLVTHCPQSCTNPLGAALWTMQGADGQVSKDEILGDVVRQGEFQRYNGFKRP